MLEGIFSESTSRTDICIPAPGLKDAWPTNYSVGITCKGVKFIDCLSEFLFSGEVIL